MQYAHFPNYILRTPTLPLSFYIALTNNVLLEEKNLQEACKNTTIQEALFLASPPLYEAFEKWIHNEPSSTQDRERMVYTVLK